MAEQDTFRERMDRAARDSQLTTEQIADLSGLGVSTVRSYRNGSRTASFESCEKLARVLGVDANWLYRGTRARSLPSPPPLQFAELGRSVSSRLIPVFGAAAGGGVALNSMIERVAAPPSLEQVAGAYAVYVTDATMEPRFELGEIVFVHPGKAPRRGQYVVVQLAPTTPHEPMTGFIRRFIELTNGEYAFDQLNPFERITIAEKDVLHVHPIVLSGSP